MNLILRLIVFLRYRLKVWSFMLEIMPQRNLAAPFELEELLSLASLLSLLDSEDEPELLPPQPVTSVPAIAPTSISAAIFWNLLFIIFFLL